MEEHCKPDVQNGGCVLFFTKKGTTPLPFRGLVDAAFVCRARQKAGYDLNLLDLPFWVVRAHLIADAIYRSVESGGLDNDDEANNGNFAIGEKGGDSDAFKLIAEHMKAIRARPKNELG